MYKNYKPDAKIINLSQIIMIYDKKIMT